MEEILQKLLDAIAANNDNIVNELEKARRQKLAGIRKDDLSGSIRKMKLSIGILPLLHEHEVYKNFQKTQNRYRKDPANMNIPPHEWHVHVYPPNGKKELYSVNQSGTAHHQKHKGKEIPAKEAKELRAIGINIKDNNILESKDKDNLKWEEIFLYYIID